MAQDRPNMLCSEVPIELLENCLHASDEPTEFLSNLFRLGHTQWLSKKYGQGVQVSKDRMNNAIIVLWLRHAVCIPATSWTASMLTGKPASSPTRDYMNNLSQLGLIGE